MRRWIGMAVLVLAAGLWMTGCRREAVDNVKPDKGKTSPTPTAAPTPTASAKPDAPAAWAYDEAAKKWVRTPPAEPIVTKRNEWVSVFDGKTLKDWKETAFEDAGKVTVADGEMHITKGKGDLTGVTWVGGAMPKTNYEIDLEAKRVDGEDFFCGLTFPVKDSCISLIAGGWAGRVIGLSCLDGYDAAGNETTSMKDFQQNQWYKFRVRVTETLIAVWIDDESVIEGKLMRTDPDDKKVPRRVSVRSEVDLSQPFGLAAYQTSAAVRNFRVRLLTDEEVAAQEKISADTMGP